MSEDQDVKVDVDAFCLARELDGQFVYSSQGSAMKVMELAAGKRSLALGALSRTRQVVNLT